MMQQTSSNDSILYATFTQRLYAFIVDCLVFIPINILSNVNTLSIKSLTLSITLTVIWLIYKPVMEWRFGATLGKMALKMRVVDEDLQAISFNQAALRFLPYFAVSISALFSTFFIFSLPGFYEAFTIESLMELESNITESNIDTFRISVFFFIFSCSSIMLDQKKQAVHDRFSRTYCIMTNKQPASQNEA